MQWKALSALRGENQCALYSRPSSVVWERVETMGRLLCSDWVMVSYLTSGRCLWLNTGCKDVQGGSKGGKQAQPAAGDWLHHAAPCITVTFTNLLRISESILFLASSSRFVHWNGGVSSCQSFFVPCSLVFFGWPVDTDLFSLWYTHWPVNLFI